ncbi:MAG: hypothetical protein Kow0063_32220 [Anaerolineae bacterium]
MTRSEAHQAVQGGETGTTLHWSRQDWAVLVLLALLTVLFFWRILTPNLADRASFPPGDFSYQFWAFSTFEARELSAGRLPLWNPYSYAGSPFWADIQSAVLYPLSLLTLLLSGPWGFSLFALEVEAIVHFWLAGVFTYLFVRRLTRQRSAALFAAVTFTFGGYLTGYPSQQLAVLETAVWLPLLLYFTDRALLDRSGERPCLRPNLPNALAAGLVWGLALLAGHPQSAMFVFYTFLLYAVFLLFMAKKQRDIFPAPRFAPLLLTPLLSILIGLGLSAIAWLPGLEYMRLSVRAAGVYEKMSGGFPLYDPIQMLLPGSVSFYSPLYVGVLPLLLAVWGGLALRRRETGFWGGLAAGALLLSFGGETFLYSPFYLIVPGFSIFRGQERAAFIVSFALAVLAGYGFKYQIANSKWQTRNVKSQSAGFKSAVSWLLVGAVGLVVLFFYGLNNAGWQEGSPFNALLGQSLWLTIMLGLIWAAVQIAGHMGHKTTVNSSPEKTGGASSAPHTFLSVCFLLIATLDLFSVNWKTNIYPALPEEQTAVPAVVQAIRQDASPGEVFRVYNEYRIYENYGLPYELEDAWGASPLRLARYDALYRSLRMERVWELLNVKYVITWREELYAPSEIIYQEPAGEDVTYVHRLNQVAPRAWLVHRVEEVEEDATLARLDAFDFDPAQVALVPPGTFINVTAPPTPAGGRIEILRRTPGSLELEVTTSGDGLLVLSEIDYPGWQAAVDGQVVPILRVDYILRGVAVPAGQHRVEVSFRPGTFLWGAILSGVTSAVLVAVAVWVHLRRRSETRTPRA